MFNFTSLIRTFSVAFVFALPPVIAGCNGTNEQSPDSSAAGEHSDANVQLQQVLDDYFEESLTLSPLYATFVGRSEFNDKFSAPISAQSLAEERAMNARFMDRIGAIDVDKLGYQQQLSYSVFKRDRELDATRQSFPTHLMPMDQMGGVHTYFALLGSGDSAQPFANADDFDKFAKRSDGFATYMDSTIEAMKEGMTKGVVLPRPVALKTLSQLQAQLVDSAEESVFWGPIGKLEKSSDLDDGDKARIAAAHKRVVEERILPAYARVAAFFENTYLPATRDSVGLSGLPNGQDWYRYLIDVHTTLPLSADEIHAFGVSEVARIRSEMSKVKQDVGFEGDLGQFLAFMRDDDQFFFNNEEEVVAAYEDVKARINARVGKLFERFPKSDYQVKPVEKFRAQSAAGASYQGPAPDGSRPGIFYINTFNLKAQPRYLVETLSIHEAAPGHHFQISLQQEQQDIPDYRKFGGQTVFVEGWALYAESLGKEMGLFTDPYMWYGRLSDEQLRAMRLVVDTGLHAKGWSRERAIAFMRENSSMAESDIVAEVERYIAMPGQALSYKIGERKIRELRNMAEAALGEDFNIKQFHTQILMDGSLPMPVLEQKLRDWVAAKRS